MTRALSFTSPRWPARAIADGQRHRANQRRVMTKPSPETIESERDKLFVTDSELIRRLGVPEKVGRVALQDLDRFHPGRPQFPQKDPLFGGRRFWPAVEKYLMLRHGVTGTPSFMAAPQWQEKHDETFKAGEAGTSGDARSRMETPKETLGRLLDSAAGHRRPRLSHRKPTLVAPVEPADGDPDGG